MNAWLDRNSMLLWSIGVGLFAIAGTIAIVGILALFAHGGNHAHCDPFNH